MNENARKWVEALRSGEFEQTQGCLREGHRYCCLGVACELYRRETGDGEWHDREVQGDRKFGIFDGSLSVLPNHVRRWLGVRSKYSDYETAEGEARQLTEDNDGGSTFTKIADIIESEPKGLFL